MQRFACWTAHFGYGESNGFIAFGWWVGWPLHHTNRPNSLLLAEQICSGHALRFPLS